MTATLSLERCTVCAEPGGEPADLGLLRCRACGTVRAREYADPDEVFSEGYFAGGAGRYGVDLRHPRFRAYLRDVGVERCAAIERALGRRGRLVDVGCGTGELVRAAADRGWEAVGVEPMADAAATAREHWGVDVRTARLEDSGLPERSFDAVCAFHVLEHVPDAPAFLRLLGRWARPGGLVAAESPNWDSVLRRTAGPGWMHLRPLEHLTHFTPATIAGAARRAGLEVVAVRSPSHLHREHTLDEALGNLGRRHWARRLAPLSPVRRVEGRPARVPSPPARAVLRAVQARDDLRGAGQTVLLLARVP